MTRAEPLGVAMIGCGTVGGGVARILDRHAGLLAGRASRAIALKHVVVRDPEKSRAVDLPAGVVTTDADGAIADPDVGLGVELIGGIEPAKSYVEAAIAAGKDVVTANKALMCDHGAELFALARDHGRTIGYEAAVAGGVPVIATLNRSLSGNAVTSLRAILNGTCNFILSKMTAEGSGYADVLAEAQRLGYAEADPAMDVDGTDTAQKLVLLAELAFGVRVKTDDFLRDGIERVDADDIAAAARAGYAIKLVASAERGEGGLAMQVGPTLVKRDEPLAGVDGPENTVEIEGDAVGRLALTGPGAGMMATASAVVADVVDVAAGRAEPPPVSTAGTPLPADALSGRFYWRFSVADRPHVVADVTDVLGKHGISLASVDQPEVAEPAAEGVVPLVVMTHATTEGVCRAAEADLKKVDAVRDEWVRLTVAD
ncbi:MAG: homoserine dehydrogenase [Planctomycetota bacterium]